MACFIVTKKLEEHTFKKELKKLGIKRTDIKKSYYANGKTLLCLKKRVKTKIDKKFFPSQEEEAEIITVDRFVERQKYLIDQERRAEIETTINEIKSTSGKEREIYGRAVLDLKGVKLPNRLGLYFIKFGRSTPIDTEISSGDIVLISRGEPLKSDLTGTVSEVGRNHITVAFDQNPPKWVRSFGIRIDLFVNDVTFKRMEENLESLRDATGKKRELRNIALGIWQPQCPKRLSFEAQTPLNDTQKEAVAYALGSSVFLVHGPPGTGKTSTMVELILQEVARGNRVLATADSNIAVDNLLQRLAKFDLELVRIGHPARILYELEEFSIHAKYEKSLEAEVIKKGWEEVGVLVKHRDQFSKPTQSRARGMSYDRILTLAARGKSQRGVSVATMQSMAKWIKANERVDAKVRSLKDQEEAIYKQIIKNADVVLATNAMVMSDIVKEEQFDVAIIDEGSQQIMASTLIPIMHAKRFIIAGDHKQLPPTVVSGERELQTSLFEEMIERFPDHSQMLRIQYRMHERIMGFSNEHFYEGKLIADESVKNHTLKDLGVCEPKRFQEVLDLVEPLIFIDTKGSEACERLPDRSTSYENEAEAKIVKELVDELLAMGVKAHDIGVISPYLAQVKRIKRLFGEPLVEVKSVDGFQGREKEVILISFVRSNPEGKIGFLQDWRRLNVALTRAKRKLICIGDSATLSHNRLYEAFLDYMQRYGKVVGAYAKI